jgi:hypothetical protein
VAPPSEPPTTDSSGRDVDDSATAVGSVVDPGDWAAMLT